MLYDYVGRNSEALADYREYVRLAGDDADPGLVEALAEYEKDH